MEAAQMAADRDRAGRTPADVSALLIELGRGWKGWRFYPSQDPARGEALDRCWRAWHSELSRSGALSLRLRDASFWLPDLEIPVGQELCGQLARAFEARRVDRLTWFPELDAATLAALLDVLVRDPEQVEREGGFEAAFYASPRLGIQINGSDYAALREAALGATAQVPPPRILTTAQSEPLLDSAPIGAETPPGPVLDPRPAVETSRDELEPGRQLRALQDQLEKCLSDQRYRELALQIAALCEARVADGHFDEGLQVLAQFARHASDDIKHSATQRLSAHGCVERLGAGKLIEALIDRASSSKADTTLHSAEILLELGAPAVPSLLKRLSRAASDQERTRLTGVLLAMGEEAAAALADEIETEDAPSRRMAMQLAGETQNPRLVPVLRSLLLDGSAEEAREAAKGLARIGNVGAFEALVEAIQSPRPSVVSLALRALGHTGRALAVAPLVQALARFVESDAPGLAREAVRALGQLKRVEAVPVLAGLLERGSFRQRKKLRDLKLATVETLAAFPGEHAERALRRARRLRDRRLRIAAAEALARRAARPAALGQSEGLA